MTRHLTSNEIEYILDFIKPNEHIPIESAISIMEINKSRFREQLTEQKVYPEIIPKLKKQMKKDYENSLIHAGESVGIICAQSIGERQTQMSVAYTERVIIKIEEKLKNVKIGEFIDKLIENTGDESNLVCHESHVLPIKNVEILSLGKNQSIKWCEITEISRHLPNGQMMSVLTESGRCVTTTLSHSHLQLNKNCEVVPILGKDLRIGHKIPIVDCGYILPNVEILDEIVFDNETIKLTENLGFLMGKYMSIGILMNDLIVIKTKHHERIHSLVKSYCSGKILRLKYHERDENRQETVSCLVSIPFSFLSKFLIGVCGGEKKIVSGMIFQANLNFLVGFLNGFLSEKRENTFEFNDNNVFEGVTLLLTYFGIYGKFAFYDKLCYVVDNINNLTKRKLCEPSVRWEPIIDIIYISRYAHKYVYDFSVNENETFALQSGIFVHNTLNTFHKAGQSEKTVTMGVPRFQEILNATKDPKTINCKVFFKEKNETIQELRKTVSNNFVELNIRNVCCDMKICVNKKREPWYDFFSVIYNSRYENYTDCISIKLNHDILYEYKLSIENIANAIEREYNDVACVFSPLQYGQLDVFVDTCDISLPENRLLFIDSENKVEIYLEECVQPTLEKLSICGISGITNIYYCKDESEWIIETDGSNFRKLLALPIVDMTRTVSNNVWEIYETLGIEAAREFLIDELTGIMEGINLCHIKLLVERMTFSGTISSISRYTMRNEDSGPLGRASFEESLENFLKAACRGEIEPTNGVSASIICGKRANIGTGMVELKVDIENLPIVAEKMTVKNQTKNDDDDELVFNDSDDDC